MCYTVSEVGDEAIATSSRREGTEPSLYGLMIKPSGPHIVWFNTKPS